MNGSYFGRIEFYGGRYIITVPQHLIDDQELHAGDLVDVRVESLSVKA